MPGTMISPALIGRVREIEILDQALHATQKGSGQCILLAGEAGIGKSRLADELSNHAAAAQFLVIQGHCSEQDRSYPYAPWVDALRAFLGPHSPVEVQELLGAFAPELVKLLPELSLLLPSIRPAPSLDPASEKHRLFETLARFTASLAAVHPLLVVLEDLHWSDGQSLELLHFFIRRIPKLPILVLGTYRSEDISPPFTGQLLALNHEHLVEGIQLAPLTRSEVSQMAEAILQAERPIPHDLLDFLMSLTEGNPFFIEEMIKSLQQGKEIPEKWDQLPIPHSIQQTILRRVEEQSEKTQHVLSLASVIGERFNFFLLQKISAKDEPSLLRMLKELITAQLIVEQTADQFSFRHALIREVVYATLMLRERRVMHQTIGETIEHFAGIPGESAPQEVMAAPKAASAASLAYHFYQAGNWQKAMEYAQRAGEKAQALYAPREALVHFTHALDAVQQLGIAPQLSTLRGRAQAYEVLGEFDRARVDNEAALELASQATHRLDEWQSLIDLGFLWQSRNLERAGEYYQSALDMARTMGDSSVLAQTLNRVGNWYFNCGQPREALQYHREALALFRGLNDRHGMANTLDLLGIVSYQLGEVIQGADYLSQAVPILRKLDDRQALVNTLTNLTVRAIIDTEVLGEINYLQLTTLSDEALQIARSFNWYQGEVLALTQGAISLLKVGEYGQALEQLARAQSMAEEDRNREAFARLHLIFGQIFLDLMAFTEAKQYFEAGLTTLQELGSGLLILAAKSNLATVAVFQSDFARAQSLLADVLTTEYPEGQEPFVLRSCWCSDAEFELAKGNAKRALVIVNHLFAATPGIAQYGPHAVPRLSRLHGQALAALGYREDAAAEWQGTLPVAHKQGQRPMLWRLHADLGRVYLAMKRRDDAEQQFDSARTIIQELSDNVPEGALRDHFLQHALATLPTATVLTSRQMAKKESGGLTAREREIAKLIAQGKSNRDIANVLVISEKTTERHVANILSKLGFNARTQIAAWVVAKGFDK